MSGLNGRVAAIASVDGYERSANDNAAPCLFLLFERDNRPDAARVRQAISNAAAWVSHDPRSANSGFAEGENWLELLIDGLTFDLLGLSPGPPLVTDSPRFLFDAPEGLDQLQAIGLAPGPHIAGASNAAPVVRSMMQLGSRVLLELGGKAVHWLPAQSVMGCHYFVQLVDRWLTGGPFPSLGLVAIEGREGGSLKTEGLAFFTNQELLISSEIAKDPIAATRLAARLIDQLVFSQSLEGERETLAPDGSLLLLRAESAEGNILVTKI